MSDNLAPKIRLGVVDDPAFDLHRAPAGHPERPERLTAARAALHAVEADAVVTVPIVVGEAAEEQLVRVHTYNYIERLAGLRGQEGDLDADTYLAPGSVTAAMRAAGAACNVVDALLGGSVGQAVALLRPPGHHARPDAAMGFCLINNVAVAAAHARARGARRVLVVDWDVHHGNGTQEMFFRDPNVLYVSLHQWPFYPGTGAVEEVGEGDGRGFTLNVPLSGGAGDAAYQAAFDRVILPVADAFAPDLVLVSAGFDAHRRDPLASMRLEASSYGRFTALLAQVAARHADGRVALFLEGGYDLRALETSLAASLRALAKAPSDENELAEIVPRDAPSPAFEAEIARAAKSAARFWPGCFSG